MNTSRAGLLLLLGFVITQAIRDVHLGHLFGDLGLFEAAFLAFGTAAIVFGIGLFLFRRAQIGLLAANWRGVLALNVTTMLAWMSFFGSLRLVEPAAANLAFSGVAPMSVTLLGTVGLMSGGEQRPSKVERWLHWLLVCIVVSLALIVSTGQSGIAGLNPLTGLAGVALAAFAGLSITAESIYAKRMNLVGISPLAIVGVRFVVVTVFTGIMVAQIATPYASMSGTEMASQALIFLAILIGPIYLAQAGLALTTPLVSGVILSIGPVATLALQSTAGGLTLAPAMLAITLLYSAVSIVAAILSAGCANRERGFAAARAA